MNPITHLLASWSLAEASALDERDRAVVAWVGVAPDLDGFGALVDEAGDARSAPGRASAPEPMLAGAQRYP